MQDLEHRLGAKLFERTNGGTRPTVAGLELFELARRIVEDTDAALMAGRLTMLLARGAEPRSIAAITRKLAASALGARVHRYVDDLLARRIPKPLREALPDGLTDAQWRALSKAAAKLDELTVAFCQTTICSYAVEADIDSGARIRDATQAANAFEAVFEQWFRRRLNGPARADDPIASLSIADRRLSRFCWNSLVGRLPRLGRLSPRRRSNPKVRTMRTPKRGRFPRHSNRLRSEVV